MSASTQTEIVPIAHLKINLPSSEWTVFQEKTFVVQIKSWHCGTEWRWNVYALIFCDHPFYENMDAIDSLPFHYGTTFEKRIVTSPANGIQYEWQRVSDILKFGSDYLHYGDHYENCNPSDGIPQQIQSDAANLVQALLDAISESEKTEVNGEPA